MNSTEKERVMAQADRGSWASRWGFVLAAAGSAVGLGNIWKFPYITGENGGGLFVLIYLVCIALVGLPIMMAEIMIGRAAQKQPVGAFHELQGGRTPWAAVGWLGVVTGFVILSYYIVVAGWAVDYALKSISNFTVPIHELAETEAKTYRATTSLDVMRETVAADTARRSAKVEIDAVTRRTSRSVWDAFARYETALAAGGNTPAVEAILLEDAEFAAKVAIAKPLRKEQQGITQRHLETARKHGATLSDREIRDAAETLVRRESTAKRVGDAFGSLYADGWTSTFWAGLFMLVTILIVAAGIASGIERTCRILMPILIALMMVMVIYGAFKPGFGEALRFVFYPDVSKLQTSGVLEALGHSFFTLSLGMGAMITYGSYLANKEGLASKSLFIVFFDTFIALLACMMIFPIIFSYGREPVQGPGLVFVSMPLAFAEIGQAGMLLAVLFFGLLVFAALTSAISLLEVVCSYFIDERGWTRHRSAWVLGAVVFLFGVPSAFAASQSFLMESWEPGFGKNFFDTMDYLASNWMLPLGGLFIAIYAGWVMPQRFRDAELEGLSPMLLGGWLFLIRLVAPVLVVVVLLQKVGIIKPDEWFR